MSLYPLSRVALVAWLLITVFFDVRAANAQAQVANAQPDQALPATLARESLPTANALDYEFQDVSIDRIERWLSWAGLTSPVEISGPLSGWIWLQRSEDGWFNFRDYRVEGEFNSPSLAIADYQLDSARLRFGYAGGRWHVGQFYGVVDDARNDQRLGRVEISGSVPLDPDQTVRLRGVVTNVNLHAVFDSVEIPIQVDNRGGQLQFSIEAPLENFSDPQSWEATASGRINDLRFRDLPALDATQRDAMTVDAMTVDAALAGNLKSGLWAISRGDVVVADENAEGQRLDLQGSGELRGDYPFTFHVSAEAVSLEQALLTLGQPEYAKEVEGIVNVRATFKGAFDGEFESIIGDYDAPRIAWSDSALENIRGSFATDDGSLRLAIDKAKIAGGQVSGTSRWEPGFAPDNLWPARAELQFASVSLSEVKLPIENWSLRGESSGEFRLTTERVEDRIAWAFGGEALIDDVRVNRASLGDVEIALNKELRSDIGDLEISSAIDAGRAYAEVKIRLEENTSLPPSTRNVKSFEMRGTVDQYPFAPASFLPPNFVAVPELAGPVLMNGEFVLSGDPGEWLRRGCVEIDRAAFVYNDQPFTMTTAVAAFNEEQFRLERFQLVVDQEQRLAGSAIFRRDDSGQDVLNIRAVDVDLATWIGDQQIEELAPLGGVVDVEARLRKDAAYDSYRRGWEGSIRMLAEDLMWHGDALGAFELEGELAEDRLIASLDGTFFGATTRANLDWDLRRLSRSNAEQLAEAVEESANRNVIDARVHGLDFGRLMPLLQESDRQVFTGQGNLSLRVQQSSSGAWVGRLTADVNELMKGDSRLTRDLRLVASLRDDVVTIERLSGEVAGGRVSATGSLAGLMGDRRSATFDALDFEMYNLDVERLADLIWPDYADAVRGLVSYRGRLRADSRSTQAMLFKASGLVQLSDASAYELPIQNVRGSLDIVLDPLEVDVLSIEATRLTGAAIGGNFSGSFELSGRNRWRLAATGRVDQGRMDQLSRGLGFEHILGTGRFNGAFQLASSRANSLAALRGPIEIEFERGNPQSVPIVSDLTRYVPLLQLGSTEIRGGKMQAIVGQGQLRIQNLLLNSNAFWLAVQGDASLLTGNLDLEAILQTGGGIEQQLPQTVLDRLALGVLPEVVLVTQLNEAIRNRTFYFGVRGTTSRPVIQPRAVRILSGVFVQNLTRQLLGVSTTSSVLDR